MSNSSAPHSPSKHRRSGNAGASVASTANRWSFIQQELESARDHWAELEKAAPGLSPEEEQFLQIKAILAQLKAKLEQF